MKTTIRASDIIFEESHLASTLVQSQDIFGLLLLEKPQVIEVEESEDTEDEEDDNPEG